MLRLIAACACLLLASCVHPVRPAGGITLFDLTGEFDAFWESSRELNTAERTAAFYAHFDQIIPGFYRAEREKFPAGQYDEFLAAALDRYPRERAGIADVRSRFLSLMEPARRRFEQAFGPTADMPPVYLVHSLGIMDGGARPLQGRVHLLFGADALFQTYAGLDLQPLFHHELFHLRHSRTFADCTALWCDLWREGLAVHVAATLNPGASDRELVLGTLRAAVEPHRAEAFCTTLARLDSTAPADMQAFFSSSRLNERLPGRFGYYVGWLVARELGSSRSLLELAAMRQEEARPAIERALRASARC